MVAPGRSTDFFRKEDKFMIYTPPRRGVDPLHSGRARPNVLGEERTARLTLEEQVARLEEGLAAQFAKSRAQLAEFLERRLFGNVAARLEQY